MQENDIKFKLPTSSDYENLLNCLSNDPKFNQVGEFQMLRKLFGQGTQANK